MPSRIGCETASLNHERRTVRPEGGPPAWRSLAEWLAPYAADMTDQDIDRIADDLRRAREEAKRG